MRTRWISSSGSWIVTEACEGLEDVSEAEILDEALRNVVAVGADPEQVALLDNFCWGNPNLPDRLVGLAALAENLWWSWRPRARMLFKMLDRQAWKESGHNPDKMLREMPAEILHAAAANPG